jgi:hypothetical protein
MLAPIEEIFCDIDDFCKEVMKKRHLLPNPNRQRERESQLSASEIMAIVVLFHLSHYRTFKDFYYESEHWLKLYFPKLVSYNRFVEIQGSVFVLLTAYLLSKSGKKTGLYYIDSTPLKVCHNRRIYRHKVFKGLAARGKSSMGWFFGFKLNLVINQKGELISFCFTRGNIDDRKPIETLFKGLQGLAAGDKGYISKQHQEILERQGLHLITKLRRNMKKKVFSAFEKFFLAHRGLIEIVIEQLKMLCQIEHTRHRKPINFFVNVLSGLVAYILRPRKPKLNLDKLQQNYALIPS